MTSETAGPLLAVLAGRLRIGCSPSSGGTADPPVAAYLVSLNRGIKDLSKQISTTTADCDGCPANSTPQPLIDSARRLIDVRGAAE